MEENLNIVFDKYIEENLIKPYVHGEKMVHDVKTYLKYLQVVVEEINIIKDIIKDFPESKEKTSLILNLDMIIHSLKYFKNNYKSIPTALIPVDPEIFIGKSYIKASYYPIDDEVGFLNECPSTIAFERNLQLIYIIDEKYSVIPEEGEEGFEDYNDEYNIGYQEMRLYAIDNKNKKIYKREDNRIEETDHSYFYARDDMISMTNKLLSEIENIPNDEMTLKFKNNQTGS